MYIADWYWCNIKVLMFWSSATFLLYSCYTIIRAFLLLFCYQACRSHFGNFFVNEHPIATLLLTNVLPFWPIKPSRFGNNTLLPLSTRAQLHFFLLCVFFLGKKEHANYYFCCYDTCGVKKTTKKKLQCGKQLIGIFCFIIAKCTKNSLFIVSCCCNACEGAC